MKRRLFSLFLITLLGQAPLNAHCQMPCGIYNDQMVYDQVNQFYKTVYKGVMAMKNNKLETVEDKNQFVRWVMTKERLCNETAEIITKFFLQQKLKPDDEDTKPLILSAHKLLFLLVAIKQTVDVDIVNDFGKEWDHFKYLFHPEVECKPVIKMIENPYAEEGEEHTHDEKDHHHHDE